MTDHNPVTLVADVHCVLGEGPVWVDREQAIYWVDIKGKAIFRLDDGGSLRRWETPFRVASLAPRLSGGFIAGAEDGVAEIDLEAARFQIVLRPEQHLPGNRFNDGKVDRAGNFWAGTMDDAEREDSGALYRFGADRSCVRVDEGFRVTNGPAFSPDGRTMYANDSARQVTYAYDLSEIGEATDRREFARFTEGEGYPDGMTVDAEGCLWIAFWDGWCLRRLSPHGERLEEIRMPVARPTSCAFGGPGLNRLYVTSARVGLSETDLRMQPNAGGLFMVDAGVCGLAERPFAG